MIRLHSLLDENRAVLSACFVSPWVSVEWAVLGGPQGREVSTHGFAFFLCTYIICLGLLLKFLLRSWQQRLIPSPKHFQSEVFSLMKCVQLAADTASAGKSLVNVKSILVLGGLLCQRACTSFV